MYQLKETELTNVNGGVIAGPITWVLSWAAGDALDWLVDGGFEKLMDSYGNAVENGNGLPGISSGGVAV